MSGSIPHTSKSVLTGLSLLDLLASGDQGVAGYIGDGRAQGDVCCPDRQRVVGNKFDFGSA